MKNLIPAIGAFMAGADRPAHQAESSSPLSTDAVVPMQAPVLTSLAAEPPIVEMPLHGVANPSQLAQLNPLVIGTIDEIHVHEGQFVQQGALLLSLDDSVPRARMEAESEGALR